MHSAHNTDEPEKPCVIRSQLLKAAQELMVNKGFHAVSLGAVASKAGYIKGELLEFFHSNQALIDAVGDELLSDFRTRYWAAFDDEDDGPACHARAYIRTCFHIGNTPEEVRRNRATAILAHNWLPWRTRWSEMIEAALAQDGKYPEKSNVLLMARLAADGFWLSQVLNVYSIEEKRQEELCALLLELCSQSVE